MKKIYIYIMTTFALLAGACSDNDLNDDAPVVPVTPDIVIPEGAPKGNYWLSFVPEMTEILDHTMKIRAVGSLYPVGYSVNGRGAFYFRSV